MERHTYVFSPLSVCFSFSFALSRFVCLSFPFARAPSLSRFRSFSRLLPSFLSFFLSPSVCFFSFPPFFCFYEKRILMLPISGGNSADLKGVDRYQQSTWAARIIGDIYRQCEEGYQTGRNATLENSTNAIARPLCTSSPLYA